MINNRIRLSIPANMQITPRSTPVLWFGNYQKASVCTISINPSDEEFYYHPRGQDDYVLPENLLINGAERLCSRERLNRGDDEPLNENDIQTIKEYYSEYFNNNPYNKWFRFFEHFLNKFGKYSYYDGSCVALDMVQWATSPKWSKLNNEIKKRHLENDIPILKLLLEKDFKIMFLNGRSVVDNISRNLNIQLSTEIMYFMEIDKNVTIFTGEYRNTKIIGWNLYLQSGYFYNFKNIDILCDLIKCGKQKTST